MRKDYKFESLSHALEVRLSPAIVMNIPVDDPLPDPQPDPGTHSGSNPPPTSGPVGPGTK